MIWNTTGSNLSYCQLHAIEKSQFADHLVFYIFNRCLAVFTNCHTHSDWKEDIVTRKLLVLYTYFQLLFCAVVYIGREHDITHLSSIIFNHAVVAGMDFLYSTPPQIHGATAMEFLKLVQPDYLKMGWKMWSHKRTINFIQSPPSWGGTGVPLKLVSRSLLWMFHCRQWNRSASSEATLWWWWWSTGKSGTAARGTDLSWH